MVKSKRVALDTNIAIDILRGDQITLQFLQSFDTVYLPATVRGELLYGLFKSDRRTKQEPRLRAFLRTCKPLNCNQLVAEEYAIIKLQLKNDGKPIPENDIWIAAISNVNQIPLMTRDKHFDYVTSLKKIMVMNELKSE